MISKEQLDELEKLNHEIYQNFDEIYGLKYEYNGFYECITFNEHVLWDSEDYNCWISQRGDVDIYSDKWDDSQDDHDPDIIYHVKMRFNDYINQLKKCRFDVKSKINNSDLEEAIWEITKDLKDRWGLGDEWKKIDVEIQQEIIDKWVNIVEKYN